ncbi:hypothetical protein NM688_g8996 [Phlebia brevispora]|uniref:Uncharacterized protein n=1 Tax=Phlebia brevispora TaxID=194682 RepID=A0ACC1RKR9_9APHY|nr:hypothetical protein NM688_g8996 [Phlebia brevispora]
MVLSTVDAALCIVALATTVLLYTYRRSNRPPYPPGPKGLPIIGNVFGMPEKRQWYTYSEWSRKYDSPIIYFEVLGTPIVVVNDFQTARDLFDKRGDIYSERPRMPMLNEALGFGWNFGFTADTSHSHLPSTRDGHDLQASDPPPEHTRKLHDAHAICMPVGSMTGSLILDISHGITVKANDDEYIEIAERAQDGMEKSGDANIVDIIPWIFQLPTWLPGMGWKKQILAWRALTGRHDSPGKCATSRMSLSRGRWLASLLLASRLPPLTALCFCQEKGAAKPCIVTDLLDNWKGSPTESITAAEKEYTIKCVASTAYSAGSDTTVAAFNVLVMTMMLFPDIQKKAQYQIDCIVGSERLPSFEDMDDLPYITAITDALSREILRWAAFVPLSVPHKTSEADVYKGYYIPKGAMIIGASYMTRRHTPSPTSSTRTASSPQTAYLTPMCRSPTPRSVSVADNAP